MKHYNFEAIKQAGSCIEFAREILGAKLTSDNRCPAVWRDGSRPDSVALTRDSWYDHGRQSGGGLIELCATARFGDTSPNSIQRAQEFLGEWLRLPAVTIRKSPAGRTSRYDDLIAEGYREVKCYDYRDLAGNVVHSVIRLEAEGKPKQFVQRTPEHWGLGDTVPILYNLAMISASEWIVVVEGEKDADTLIELGIPATTVCGGAKKWRHEYAETFRNKPVIILPDNDEVGREHAVMIATDLAGTAGGVKLLTCSDLPKGDVTDYFEKEGGTWEALAARIKAAPEFEAQTLDPVEAAREANRRAFCNFSIEEKELGKRKIRDKVPRLINELVRELHVRLLGAPYRIGEKMFDQDRDTDGINYIHDSSGLFSWIARKTDNRVEWAKNDGCVTKAEFFEALLSEAKEYASISFIPDYPQRSDVYYAHRELPPPSDGHQAFWNFVDCFSPVDDVNRSLIATFIMSPIFYLPKVDKPMWIIDSPDGQGSGKSTIPFLTAYLYGGGRTGSGGEVIDVAMYDLEKNYSEVVKRLISTEGRQGRIFLLDNVKGMLKSANLAKLVTCSAISGRASYGRGEESRPNNLTYVVTINSATVDTDIASRSFYIMVRKPKRSADWKVNTCAYIEQNRMQIFADIIDIIAGHRPFDMEPQTRNPEFETRVLQAACQSPEQYLRVMEFLKSKKEETNNDEEIARRIEEEIFHRLIDTPVIPGRETINPETDRVFIRSGAIEEWFRGKVWLDRQPISIIRNLAQTGMLPQVSPRIAIWPHHSTDRLKRRNGILWNHESTSEHTRVVGFNNKGSIIELCED